jgi:hypothetical protein
MAYYLNVVRTLAILDATRRYTTTREVFGNLQINVNNVCVFKPFDTVRSHRCSKVTFRLTPPEQFFLTIFSSSKMDFFLDFWNFWNERVANAT